MTTGKNKNSRVVDLTGSENEALLDYPFDLYQRTRDIREILEILVKETGNQRFRILDVGGYRVDAAARENLLLREFLPQHSIVALDMVESSTPGYVRGDGTQLPFKNNSFDIIVSSDVYEHIPPQLRPDFIRELTRVARHLLILGAPFYSCATELAEQILFEYIRKILFSQHEQLKEHIDHGLPDPGALERLLSGENLPFISFASGTLGNWLLLMMVKHYLMTIPGSERLHRMLDRFCNRTLYEYHHSSPAYREVFVIAKDPSLHPVLEKIKNHFHKYSQANQSNPWNSNQLGEFRLLLDLEELRTRSQLAEKNATIQAQAERIQELERQRLTRVYRFLLFFQLRLYAPVVRSVRLVLSKFHTLGQVLLGKRKHPWLSISKSAYGRWIKKQEPTAGQWQELEKINGELTNKPLITIVIPCYNTERQWIEKALDSVLNQLYTHWETLIVDDGSKKTHVAEVLEQYQKKDARIKPIYLRRNQGIAGASNEALAIAKGEFIAFMDSDDELHPLALFEMVRLINEHPEADVIFSDEDKLTLNGQREKPEFKPGWSPDLFLTYNYINHLTLCRKRCIDTVGGFRSQYDWSQDYDLYLRVTEQTSQVFHLPRVLYHWRSIPGSSAAKVDTRPQALASSRHLLEETLKRRGIKGIVKNGLRPATFKIKKRKK